MSDSDHQNSFMSHDDCLFDICDKFKMTLWYDEIK